MGKDNKFGHPSEKTLETLNNKNVKVYRTDISGETVIITDGDSVKVKSFLNTS